MALSFRGFPPLDELLAAGKSLQIEDGSDGTRTRDLRRDRPAF
jgi:hypothetical protein